MTLGLAFWILMLFWFIFGVWQAWPAAGQPPNLAPFGGTILLFVLLLIVGWHDFGAPLHG